MKKRIDLANFIFYVSFTVFSLAVFLFDGIHIPADADSYLSMASYREPVYPLFLAGCRLLSETYLMDIAVWLQNILYICAVCYCFKCICDTYVIPILGKVVLFLIPMGIVFFTEIVVDLEYWFINGIQSEGLALPFWLFFIAFLLQYVYLRKDRHLYLAVMCACILFNTRKQLVICFLIIGVLGICLWALKSINAKQFFKACGVVFIGGILTLLVGPLYHLFVFGEFQSYTDTNSAFLTPVAYGSDREMGEKIDNLEIRNIFYQVYDRAEELGYNYKNADHGWKYGKSERMEHYEASFNLLAFGVLRNDIMEYVNTLGLEDEFQRDLRFDAIEGELAFSLMPYAWKNILPVFWNSILYGIIFSIAKTQTILTPLSFLLFFLNLVLIVVCCKRKKKRSAILGGLTCMSIVINTIVTSFFIFPQTRYMIYGTMFFYWSLLIMLLDLLGVVSEKELD